jgi:serine/threonine protein kinase/tetratricopeptide (TPR) repeat protein
MWRGRRWSSRRDHENRSARRFVGDRICYAREERVGNETGDDFAGTERFEVRRRLGAGGMGVVYEAYDRERNTVVALKTLRSFKPDALLRFKNEFRALADIQHPNLVGLGELFEDQERWFFTMDMVHGVHFLDYIRRTDEPEELVPASSSTVAPASAATAELATVDEPDVAVAVRPRPPRDRRGRLDSGADEERLRSAFAQLALGLAALHRAKKVHRDIKPSNILVTPEGRVVVLDFGLVADLLNMVPESHLVGTFSYMAPEQAGLKPIGPAADWYSVGVLLYQALTGRLPVTGAAREVLVLKQAFEPAPPHVIADVPEDLDRLAMDLLRIDPTQRPSGPEILRRLHAQETADLIAAKGHASHFVGRAMELEALRRALAVARKTRGVTFFVHGESGVGKSALVRRFTDGITEQTRDAVVFSGRCYERENVPYKAVDGIVDALSRHLTSLDAEALNAILPRQRGLLGQVFPVMRRIEAVAQAPKAQPGALDPQIQRARLFYALRELFTRLAERAPLVLVIDDLQWADADSLALLAELMRPPDAPRLLLLATMRVSRGNGDAPRAGGAIVRSVDEVAALFGGDVRRLDIQALPRDEAQALVKALLRDAGAEEHSVDQIAEAAAGHPLFIDELVRRRITMGPEAGPLKLDEALWARIARLDAGVRAVLEIVAVAAVPIPQEIAAVAAKIEFAELVRRVTVLRAASLVRTAGVRRSDAVEPYHDRVVEAVLLHIDDAKRAECHARLALALEASDKADPEALATHWRGAGDLDKAVVYARRAAAQAEEALAFDRAARLYKLSIELRPGEGVDRANVLAKLGDALANAGRGAEAAPVYLEAARLAAPNDALTLRRRGAEELLRCGRIDEALAEYGAVLAAVDLELPETPQRALASLLYRRARVRLRGLSFKPREAQKIPPDVLQRIDTCWSVAPVMGMVDIIRGADFQARCLLMALEAGEPYRVARALAAEACSAATEGGRGRDRTEKLLSAAVNASRNLGDPYTMGWLEIGNILSSYLEGRWQACYEACQRAEKVFSRCIRVWWEMATVELYAMLSLFWLGDFHEQQRRVDRTLRQGKERGDNSAIVNACTGFNTVAWLARDDPAGARREIDDAMARWSRRGFLLAHYWELLGRVQISLYEGDGTGAHALLEARWPALSRSLLQRAQLISVESLFLRGRASIAYAAQRTAPPAEVARLLKSAESDAREIEAERMAYATPLASLLRAGASALRGETGAAKRCYADAAVAFDAANMTVFAAVARRRHGLLEDSEAGRAEIAAAEAAMRSRGIVSAARTTALLAPGLPERRA